MPTRPQHHPLAELPPDRTPRIPRRVAHDGRPQRVRQVVLERPVRLVTDEDGSVATEYGLLAVVAATVVSVLLEWATSGGITNLLAAVLARVSELVGL